MRIFQLFLVAVGCISIFGQRLSADPGMWPLDMIPVEQIEKKYGVKLSPELIDKMRASMVRMNSGGSGSFVSPSGLIATNHHVAKAALKQISTKENDYENQGFTAQSQDQEIRIPNYEVNALVGIEDVTAKVLAAVKEGMSDFEAQIARQRAIAEIEEQYFAETGAKPQVINLFRGGVYHLYKFKRYRDVRLVWAPENQAGFYGGDEEANFHYPRYALDVALFRVYDENGQPVKNENYLPISPYGTSEGELLFIVGNPGSTKRLLGSQELIFERDVFVPLMTSVLEDREAAMIAFSQTGPEGLRLGSSELFGLQNSLKVYRGMLRNFADNRVVEKKKDWELQMKTRLAAFGKAEEWEQALQDLAAAQKAYELLFEKSLATGSLGLNSIYLQHAADIAAIASESKKPLIDRLTRYRPSNRPSLEMSLTNTQKIYPELEKAKLIQSLRWIVRRFGAEHLNVSAILDGRSIEQRAQELSESEILFDPKKRKETFDAIEAGTLKLEDIKDSWINVAQKLRFFQEQLDEEMANKVNGPMARAFAKILELRRVAGDLVYPDATFSPRLTYGVVESYVDHGIKLPAYTTIGQAFDQAEARDNEGFWELPKSWTDARAAGRIDRSVPYNFVSKHDTIGGNSGSPVINQRGEWVGIIFDGNKYASGQVTHSEPNSKIGRTVSLDCRAVLSTLAGIYRAGYFLDEIRAAYSAGQASH
jgi:hypothetical protein